MLTSSAVLSCWRCHWTTVRFDFVLRLSAPAACFLASLLFPHTFGQFLLLVAAIVYHALHSVLLAVCYTPHFVPSVLLPVAVLVPRSAVSDLLPVVVLVAGSAALRRFASIRSTSGF